MSIYTSNVKVVERVEHPTSEELLNDITQDVKCLYQTIGEVLAPAFIELTGVIRTFLIAHLRAQLLSLPPALAKRIAYGLPDWLILRLP